MADLTDRKAAEEALAQERRLLETLMNNLPDAIYFKDRESRFLAINVGLEPAARPDEPFRRGRQIGLRLFHARTRRAGFPR